jgi:hypothetical protein
MESSFKERMYPLKNNGVVKLNFSFSFAIKFAFTSSFSLRAENCSFPKIIISSVYMPMIPNRVPMVVIRKQGSNMDIVIRNFFLWYLL